MKKIIILDYTDDTVYIKDYIEKDWKDALEFLTEHGFNPTHCSWMQVDTVKISVD